MEARRLGDFPFTSTRLASAGLFYGVRMAAKKKDADSVQIEILRDGVFVAEDVRCDKGSKPNVPASIADDIVKNGHARRV